jgi:TupA-like ATPgrasp
MNSNRLKEKFGDILTSSVLWLSPFLLTQYRYFRATRKLFNTRDPRTFDEKLLWLNLYWRHPLKARCSDKYAVRSYLEERGMGHLLKKLVGVYSSVDEIDFDKLPDQFVLKATHGCGFNIICKDKSRLDIKETKRKLRVWMKTDISRIAGELHYGSIEPRIICEAFLEERSGEPISDYKVYCFSGRAHCTMACTDRNEKRANYDFYSLGWKNKLAYSKTSLLANRNIPKPAAYEEIIEAAEKLSKPFPFVRMDFFSVNGKALFGEMTFSPNGGIDIYLTDLAQNTMGQLLQLPEKLPR